MCLFQKDCEGADFEFCFCDREDFKSFLSSTAKFYIKRVFRFSEHSIISELLVRKAIYCCKSYTGLILKIYLCKIFAYDTLHETESCSILHVYENVFHPLIVCSINTTFCVHVKAAFHVFAGNFVRWKPSPHNICRLNNFQLFRNRSEEFLWIWLTQKSFRNEMQWLVKKDFSQSSIPYELFNKWN